MDLFVRMAESMPEQQVLPRAIFIAALPHREREQDEFDKDADAILKAFIDSLPGGTFDALLGKMLAHRASHFVVAFGG